VRFRAKTPGDENGVAMKILGRLKELGLRTEIVEAERKPNLIASLEGDSGGPPFSLMGNGRGSSRIGLGGRPYGGIIKDGRLYGRGL
jgi:acetylornithine deacetylase/succinyl-diaminopimelate desuccinylase-like protein